MLEALVCSLSQGSAPRDVASGEYLKVCLERHCYSRTRGICQHNRHTRRVGVSVDGIHRTCARQWFYLSVWAVSLLTEVCYDCCVVIVILVCPAGMSSTGQAGKTSSRREARYPDSNPTSSRPLPSCRWGHGFPGLPHTVARQRLDVFA